MASIHATAGVAVKGRPDVDEFGRLTAVRLLLGKLRTVSLHVERLGDRLKLLGSQRAIFDKLSDDAAEREEKAFLHFGFDHPNPFVRSCVRMMADGGRESISPAGGCAA